MKYQKSMMKLMECLLFSEKGKSIESLIHEAKTGRNSSFNALNFLEKKGFVKIENFGNQKIVSLVKDNYSMQFKYYLDSIEFKSLDPFVKLISFLFISFLQDKKKIKVASIFGSSIKDKDFNDIDFLILGDNLNLDDLKSLDKIKDKIERIFGVIINIHKDKFEFSNFFKGVVIYQSSYFFDYTKPQQKYLEFIDFIYDAIVGGEKEIFDSALLNLAYVYCFSKSFYPQTKSEASDFFNKKYKIKNLSELKKRGIEIGKEIFI